MTDNQDIKVQDQIQGTTSPLQKYNMQVIKNYFLKSKYTLILLAVIWTVFVLQCIFTFISVGNNPVYGISVIYPEILVKMGANIPILVKAGQIYRLFTATILHAGILHIAMNSLTLLVFCAEVEAMIGVKLYLITYIIGGIQGNMLTDFYNLHLGKSFMIGIGASTSICAIMGYYMAHLYIESKKTGTVELAKKQIISMLISLVVISILPGIDFFGHFGSLIGGILFGMGVIPGDDKELTKIKWIGRFGFGIYTFILFAIFI